MSGAARLAAMVFLAATVLLPPRAAGFPPRAAAPFLDEALAGLLDAEAPDLDLEEEDEVLDAAIF